MAAPRPESAHRASRSNFFPDSWNKVEPGGTLEHPRSNPHVPERQLQTPCLEFRLSGGGQIPPSGAGNFKLETWNLKLPSGPFHFFL